MSKYNFPYIFLLLSSIILSCDSDDEPQQHPEVFTISAATGTNGGVDLLGSYNSNGKDISEIGFEYSLDSLFNNSILLNSELGLNNEIDYFIANGINENVKYFYKAFAKSSGELFFGDTKNFISDGSVAPEISAISDEFGVIADTLEIYGTYFKDDNYQTFLDFSGIRGEIISLNDSIIKCKVPVNIESIINNIRVKIDNREDSYASFTLRKPQIKSINLLNATFRDELTISGENFDFEISRNKVYFGNIEATITYADRNTLKVIVPDDLENSSEQIKVMAQLQKVVFNENFQLLPPEIDFAPKDVYVTQDITIQGAYFHPILNRNKISIEDIVVNLTNGNTESLDTKIPLGPFPRRKATVKIQLLDLIVEYSIELNILDKWVMVSDNLPFRFRRGPKNAVVANNVAYILARKKDNYIDTSIYLWKFNNIDFTWEQVNTNIPEHGTFASGILETNGSEIFYYTSNASNEFWKYSIESNTWSTLSNFPGLRRDYPAHFSIGNDIYIGIGADILPYTPISYKDFYKYNTLTDEWNQISDLPFDIWGGHRRTGMASFVINKIAYLAGGASNTGDIDAWSYNSNSDLWEQIANFPIINKESVGFQINGLGYVTGGGWGSNNDKSWVYAPNNNTWEESDNIIQARGWHFSFVLNGKAYIGGGDNDSGGSPLDNLYEYIP
jgi:hypothetical protein